MKQFSYQPRVMDWDGAAFYLGIGKKTLERYVRAGKIDTRRLESPDDNDRMLDKVVFDRVQLDRFVEKYLR